jgi:hypothetical protein
VDELPVGVGDRGGIGGKCDTVDETWLSARDDHLCI